MLGWLRLDIVKLLLMALPALAVKQLLVDVDVQVAGRSWNAALVVLPPLILGWIGWHLRRTDRPTVLGNGYIAFFLVYCLGFALAADSDVLTGPRVLLSGYEDAVPRQLASSSSWGDWHYWWAPPAPPAQDLIVVSLPSSVGQLREDVRRQLAFLIRQGLDHQARGMAFDYYLREPSEADALLKSYLDRAAERGMPVIFGYRHEARDGMIVRQRQVTSLSDALPLSRLGHLAGYREDDGRVRMVPVDLPGNRGLRSLSYRIAEVLRAADGAGGRPRVPRRGLLHLAPPKGGIRVERFSPDLDWELWRDRFVVVGTADVADLRETPFGPLLGAVIHAYAANELRHEHLIHRLDPRWTFPVIFLLGYVLTVLEAQGVRRWVLSRMALLLSAVVAAISALAMRYGLIWIDLSYPLAAIWLLTGLLLAGRLLGRIWAARKASEPTLELPLPELDDGAAEAAGFDVFLSHNGKDKPQVRRIGECLKTRGLKPWLDEWELVPGRPWQEALEGIISTTRSSAVLVGRDGLGPWEVPEMRASLSECVRRGLPVIPVLLPGAGARPILPLFLTQYTWVDLRGGLTEDGLNRLEWGVTGVKPRRS